MRESLRSKRGRGYAESLEDGSRLEGESDEEDWLRELEGVELSLSLDEEDSDEEERLEKDWLLALEAESMLLRLESSELAEDSRLEDSSLEADSSLEDEDDSADDEEDSWGGPWGRGFFFRRMILWLWLRARGTASGAKNSGDDVGGLADLVVADDTDGTVLALLGLAGGGGR